MFDRVLFAGAAGLLCLVIFAAPAAAGCPDGQTTCSGQCVDLTSDADDCGACGHKCPRAHECRNGACRLACPDVQFVCGNICVTPTVDPRHCGGCGIACADHEYCSRGQCKPIGAADACPAGQAKCGGKCRDVQVDEAHCGACGKRCGAGEICQGGKCRANCAPAELPTKKLPSRTGIRRRR